MKQISSRRRDIIVDQVQRKNGGDEHTMAMEKNIE